ncbi:hypothetical protein CFOL_v3_22374 [Cephalotus follicularis]|uniref:Uncharacterized protein n=1 Tax=Cephalotus follicularis TaxID=3775 RepID=A0A1Q3CF92_CEPFO|nr:hypothetical protein CFOL_v3_22374 [Cephalotus follicularis]
MSIFCIEYVMSIFYYQEKNSAEPGVMSGKRTITEVLIYPFFSFIYKCHLLTHRRSHNRTKGICLLILYSSGGFGSLCESLRSQMPLSKGVTRNQEMRIFNLQKLSCAFTGNY